MKILVTGSPKSGTTWFSLVLRDAGLDVYHEKCGSDGSVSSYLAVQDYWYHGCHVGEEHSFDSVWHLVRNPLRVIPSVATMRPSWWHWQEKHTGVSIADHSRLECAARFWLNWTKRVDSIAHRLVRVEDIENEDHSKEIGHTPGSESVTLGDFTSELSERIAKQAAHYGYAL